MNRAAGFCTMLAVLLLVGGAARADQFTVLNQVRSDVRGSDCRITFLFTGDVRFSSEQIKGAVRLVFPQTRPATAMAIARRDPGTGPVHGITFARSADGSLLATVMLAPGSTYRCVCPAGGQELYVDVHGDPGTRLTSAGVSTQAQVSPAPTQESQKTAAHTQAGQTQASDRAGQRSAAGFAHASGRDVRPSPTEAAQSTDRQAQHSPAMRTSGAEPVTVIPTGTPPVRISVIDIPAMARRQMEAESQEQSQGTAPVSAVQQPHGLSAGMALFISLCVSLISTATGLGAWWLMRRRALRRQPVPAVVQDRAPRTVRLPDDVGPTEYHVRSEEEARMLEDMIRTSTQKESEEEEYGRETSLQMARTFRRGSEEIALAQRLHDQGAPVLSPGRLDTVLSRATTSGQRIQAARKLGVGRGEFDLALKLKSMQREKKEGLL